MMLAIATKRMLNVLMLATTMEDYSPACSEKHASICYSNMASPPGNGHCWFTADEQLLTVYTGDSPCYFHSLFADNTCSHPALWVELFLPLLALTMCCCAITFSLLKLGGTFLLETVLSTHLGRTWLVTPLTRVFRTVGVFLFMLLYVLQATLVDFILLLLHTVWKIVVVHSDFFDLAATGLHLCISVISLLGWIDSFYQTFIVLSIAPCVRFFLWKLYSSPQPKLGIRSRKKSNLGTGHTPCFGIPVKQVLFWTLLFGTQLVISFAADADSSSSSGPPLFKATKLHYAVWFTNFCGWVALKYPELIDIINGDDEEPDEPAAGADQADIDAYSDWWKRNKRVYGALIQAVPTALRTSLSANARYNGLAALAILQARFGVVDASDRAAALKRVSKSYISPGSSVSVKDVTRQYDRMTEAHSEFTEAGGNPIDDELLRTYFMSALPASYQHIKTAIRTQDFDDFDALYTAFLVQVKQYEDDADNQRNAVAFPGHQGGQEGGDHFGAFLALPHIAHAFQAFRGGRARGQKGAGGRGRGRGRAGGAAFSFVTCLRCGQLGHSRNVCTQLIARCIHCAADHLAALCPRGPGGAQRDALTQGARSLLDQDVNRAQQQAQQQGQLVQPVQPAPVALPPPAPQQANAAIHGVDDATLAAALAHFQLHQQQQQQNGGVALQQPPNHGFFALQQPQLPWHSLLRLFVVFLLTSVGGASTSVDSSQPMCYPSDIYLNVTEVSPLTFWTYTLADFSSLSVLSVAICMTLLSCWVLRLIMHVSLKFGRCQVCGSFTARKCTKCSDEFYCSVFHEHYDRFAHFFRTHGACGVPLGVNDSDSDTSDTLQSAYEAELTDQPCVERFAILIAHAQAFYCWVVGLCRRVRCGSFRCLRV